MKVREVLVLLVLSLTMFWVTGAAAPAPGEGESRPMFYLFGVSGIGAHQEYLYVMADGNIMQYATTDMKLIKTATLPEPPSPPSPPPGGCDSNLPPALPPPPMAGSHGLWPGDGVLYVLAGPVLHVYSTPQLTLQSTVELPKPGFPPTGN
ncbi:MAG TPA: hypothetical protein DCZ69_04950 [Syntrophobacteraceae bacterium]|nr:hypothetical protein [Syntrophobacteraceae bacterium]